MAINLDLKDLAIYDGAGGVASSVNLAISSNETTLSINGQTFTPDVPTTLSRDGDNLKLSKGATGYGAISKGDLRDLLVIAKVNNTSDEEKPLSLASIAALNTKQEKITSINKLAMPLVDGLSESMTLLATKADLNALSANVGLGIKYEWISASVQAAQTGMVAGEQGVLVGAYGVRDVYSYKDGAWVYAYKLSANHDHDDRYYQKREIDSTVEKLQKKTDNVPMAQVSGLATAIDGLATKAMVGTNVPVGAVFTDQKWDGADNALQRIMKLENANTSANAVTGVVVTGKVKVDGCYHNSIPLDDFLVLHIDPEMDSLRITSNGTHWERAGSVAEFKMRVNMTSYWPDPDNNKPSTTGRGYSIYANGKHNHGILGFRYRDGHWCNMVENNPWTVDISLYTQIDGRFHHRRYQVHGTRMVLFSDIKGPERMLIHSTSHKTSCKLDGSM